MYVYIMLQWGFDEFGQWSPTIVGATTDVKEATDFLLEDTHFERSVEKWDGKKKVAVFANTASLEIESWK